MSDFSKILFPYNGQYFRLDGFMKQIEKLVAAAKVFETATAKRVNDKVRKEILKEMAERLRKSSE